MLKGIVIVIRFGDFGIEGIARKGAPTEHPERNLERYFSVLHTGGGLVLRTILNLLRCPLPEGA